MKLTGYLLSLKAVAFILLSTVYFLELDFITLVIEDFAKWISKPKYFVTLKKK